MKTFVRILFYVWMMASLPYALQAQNHRLIVTTDIGGTDPDDEESMVHLLTMANDVDIEGLICQMAFVKSPIGIDVLGRIIDAYEEALPCLRKHDKRYPSADALRQVAVTGQPVVGLAGVGQGHDTPGSELIIRAVDKKDNRPIWLTAWGGMNTIAQALWKVKTTRSEAEVSRFLSKIRIYDVLGQCDAGAWIAKTFPTLLYIRNIDVYGWGPSDEWIRAKVQPRGALGKVYPMRRWAAEGDTPAFLYVVNNGLNLPDSISAASWGGRFAQERKANVRGMDWVAKNHLDESVHDDYYMHVNTSEGGASISRWKSAILNDFEARMQWSVCADYAAANHHPVVVMAPETKGSRQPVYLKTTPGKELTLDASRSRDPDGDVLSWHWYVIEEVSTVRCTLQGETSARCTLSVPRQVSKGVIHLIAECCDAGSPALASYRRIIIEVK